MANQIIVSGKDEVVERKSFIASVAVKMGYNVELGTDGKLDLATAAEKTIGAVDNMPQYITENGTNVVAADDIAQVALFGNQFSGYSGGTFDAGAYLKMSSGKLIDSEATATEVIALEASTAADQFVKYLVK